MVYLGTSDDVTACDCCGRIDLKSTVALEDDHGNVVHYGVVCAAKALKTTAKVVRSETRKADNARDEAARVAREVARQAESARWDRFYRAAFPEVALDWGGKVNVYGCNQAAGGFAAVRARFAEWSAVNS